MNLVDLRKNSSMNINKCLNLHTEWKAFGDGVNTEIEERRKSACYGYNFRVFHGNQRYEIWMYHSGDGFKAGCRNDTFLGKEEIVNHVEYIRDLLPKGIVTDIQVEDDNDEGGARKYKLSLQIHGKNIYHKLVLNWIRYAYELPYSLILKDVLRMEEKGDFKELGRLNKFILASSVWTSKSGYYWREDMSFGHYTDLMTEKRLLEKLMEESGRSEQYLENVFGAERFKDGVVSLQEEDLLETDNWIEGNNYGKRIECYKTNYNIYNKLYEQEKTT
jgi:hypothetical protein